MQIVIPMSGVGQRFIDAGYTDPKPLIQVDGKPIIEHVVNLFSDDCKFLFICNSKHLEETNMKEVLGKIAKNVTIIEIPPHKKGPVYAVQQAYDYILDDEEVIVNYCDFSTYWDYHDFLDHTRKRNADGAIPSYKGFHPHMMGSTNYAFMRDESQWILEIKEKEPFTDNRMNEYASNGTYYFKNGELLKKYFSLTIERDLNLKGEYYVSLVFNLLVEDKLKVSIYEIQHMLQWGTPQDVEEYKQWSNYFSKILNYDNELAQKTCDLNVVIPMAGRGSRFSKEGILTPKPLIDVSGKQMVSQAIDCLPKASNYFFVCQREHLAIADFEKTLAPYETKKIIPLSEITEGQACSAELGVREIGNSFPILIAPCDNGMTWRSDEYENALSDEPDVIVWTFKNYAGANRNPQMYGWVRLGANTREVEQVSVKKAISSNPSEDLGIVGTFYFKNKDIFYRCYEYLLQNKIKVNGEYYVDSMVAVARDLGLKVKAFTIDDYICWGTPVDLNTYNYWQSFFHKCNWHPYKIENDPTVNQLHSSRIVESFYSFEQKYR